MQTINHSEKSVQTAGIIKKNILTSTLYDQPSLTAAMKLLEKPLRNLPRDLPTMNDRIEHLRCVLGYPVTPFTTKVGSGPPAMKNVLLGKKDPTMSLLNNILKIFPVNQEWLFLGHGEPFTVDDISEYVYKKNKDKEDDSGIETEINERFREVRLDSGLSQVLFASDMNLTKDMVASIESNRQNISITTLKKLSKKFNVSELWLLYGVGNKYKRQAQK